MSSVLAVHNPDVLLNQGYGFANLEWSISNIPTTKYRLGSLTKQFTAAAILLLEERGLLNIEDYIIQHMPNAATAWKDIKILVVYRSFCKFKKAL
jgi:CubicO group peptidase (beta-lactamase class C family)